MLDTSRFRGVYPAVATPFDADENINEKAFRKLINHLIEQGVHGLFPVGSQGESFALTMDEKKLLLDIAIEEANGRVPILASTSAVTTRECLELVRYAEAAGADAASVLTPWFISPSQDELYHHYAAIAQETELPIFAYNNPGRTSVDLKPQTAARLAHDFPNFVGIKDSSGDLTNTIEYITQCPDNFCAFVGRDTLIYAALQCGAKGAVAATGNVAPRIVAGIYDAFQAGDIEKSKDLQKKLAPIRRAFALGTFPVVVKEAMNLLGLNVGLPRRPVLPMSDENREKLRAILKEAGLL